MRINLDKNELIPMGKVDNVEELVFEFDCKMGSLPSSYLGLPFGAPFKSMSTWDGVEEMFCKRMAMWKRQYISKGGRITLSRSTLSSLAIYFMSLLCMPRMVRLRLEQIQRDFLWGDGALEWESHLVRWAIVCLDKRKGRLELSIFLPLIRLSLASGVGILQMRGGPFGIK